MVKLSYGKLNHGHFCKNNRISAVMISLTICILLLCGCGIQKDETTWELEESMMQSATEKIPEGMEADSGYVPEQTKETGVYVYICGAVYHPGVYELAGGSRLYEAVSLAGGMTAEADSNYLNLAEELKDGEQIVVPTKEEAAELRKGILSSYQDAQISALGLVNINTASAQELMQLNGIGESRALAIVTYRDDHGGFTSIEEIKNVTGIKEGLYEKIKDKITIG